MLSECRRRALRERRPRRLCNGIDDDCDGTVDNFVTSCGVGGCGATGLCIAGEDSCTPGEPSVETCNNVDDDCDGTVDAIPTTCGLGPCASVGSCVAGVDSCTPGTPSPETCNEVDDDCDGTIDDFATSCGTGACAATGLCSHGFDSCAPGAPALETCNGIDDDCDGATDDAPAISVWTAEGELRRAPSLGTSVATAGDVNGDGYDDVIVGAPFYSDGAAREGRALVYLGSASGLAAASRLDGRRRPGERLLRLLGRERRRRQRRRLRRRDRRRAV